MSARVAFCLLLICASFAAVARDVSHAGANGDGGTCPEALSATTAEEVPTRPAAKRTPATADKSSRSRGGGDNPVRTPRWHSFLPGMFR